MVGREGRGEGCWELSQMVTLPGQSVITILHARCESTSSLYSPPPPRPQHSRGRGWQTVACRQILTRCLFL